ncbi:hypothetical protein ND861_05375 [Leptospira sp. 2 VSF19]|uniref:Ig-like domain-containing protein n=1 Tax=Leptospira soteropolitanensis TaxID=2950025 RepID=A0AAW5VID1_9LEPT|nr:hypothetical protein [Leptospira soteropolitanensis]MCW7492083.1 hypothetical protein [Leptospira soteropolitanensis]MCW7499665.1 hypothetical protein [Leptospira soteropolitanensis]MCW7521916.1 hypothetical protein [Leptospira soteropolitanensis]MCW7525770.1 hypothetical protein [Leptospira soteropolitanensis]MCW7530116.1 hypothetical protein [Leptospira soteropolitanensis]
MNSFRRFRSFIVWIVFFLLGFFFPIFSESKTIRFTLEPDRDDIIQYEFELWKEPNLDLEIPFRVVASPGKIQLYIPNGYEYFRIRAVAKRQVRGFWTDLYAVKSFGKPKPKEPSKIIARKTATTDVLVPIQKGKGINHFYLTENKIQVKPILSQPMKTSVRYRVNGGSWMVTNQPELTFSNDGNYKLEYQVTNELGISDSMQVWEFSVDNTPPTTELHWEPPLYQKTSSAFVGPNTRLELKSSDLGSGLDVIRFRTTCGNNVPSEWYHWDIQTSFENIVNSCSEDLDLEISATDKLGNEEIPKKIKIQRTKKGN